MGFDTRGKVEYRRGEGLPLGGRIPVLTSFREDGKMRPMYIQIEDPLEGKITLPIEQVLKIKDIDYAACKHKIFTVEIRRAEKVIKAELVFQEETHIWTLKVLS